MSSISNIFGKKAVKSFAEQLAEVKNILRLLMTKRQL